MGRRACPQGGGEEGGAHGGGEGPAGWPEGEEEGQEREEVAPPSNRRGWLSRALERHRASADPPCFLSRVGSHATFRRTQHSTSCDCPAARDPLGWPRGGRSVRGRTGTDTHK